MGPRGERESEQAPPKDSWKALVPYADRVDTAVSLGACRLR